MTEKYYFFFFFILEVCLEMQQEDRRHGRQDGRDKHRQYAHRLFWRPWQPTNPKTAAPAVAPPSAVARCARSVPHPLRAPRRKPRRGSARRPAPSAPSPSEPARLAASPPFQKLFCIRRHRASCCRMNLLVDCSCHHVEPRLQIYAAFDQKFFKLLAVAFSPAAWVQSRQEMRKPAVISSRFQPLQPRF